MMLDTNETLIKYIENFKNGINKDPLNSRKNKIGEMDIDENLCAACAYQGYLDACRTFTKIKDTLNNVNYLKDIFSKIGKDVCSWYDKNFSNFEEKHKNCCKNTIEYFKPYKIEYGQAQKIINMAIKYLYLFVPVAKKTCFNENLHMTLDSYILNWYFSHEKAKRFLKSSNNISWSTLNSDIYCKIQKDIKEWLQNGNENYKIKNHEVVLPRTRFEAEFIIWEEEIRKKQAKEFINSLKNYMEKNEERGISEYEIKLFDKDFTKKDEVLKNQLKGAIINIDLS